MKKLLIKIVVIAAIAGAGFFLYQVFMPKDITIDDLGSTQTVIIEKKHGQGEIGRLELTVTGSFRGEGVGDVMLKDGNSLVRKKEVKGTFKHDMSGIWYSNTAKIEYIPVNPDKGYVTIKYKFIEK